MKINKIRKCSKQEKTPELNLDKPEKISIPRRKAVLTLVHA